MGGKTLSGHQEIPARRATLTHLVREVRGEILRTFIPCEAYRVCRARFNAWPLIFMEHVTLSMTATIATGLPPLAKKSATAADVP